MQLEFLINIFVPIITGIFYFIMAVEVIRVSKIRKFMFGEIGYKKLFIAFVLFGIYFITRPLQNVLGAYPMPMIVNSFRQFFIMGIIAPSIFVGILHWVPGESGAPKSMAFASYAIGILMGIIFSLTNSMAVTGDKIIATVGNFNLYDAVWFAQSDRKIQLVMIHLICQLVSPVGIILLAAAFVRHRRHNYLLGHIYTNMKTKWRYLETGLIILPLSFVLSGVFAFFGRYYQYLWTIYFIGAIVAGLFVLYSIKLAPRNKPKDLEQI